MNGVQGDKVNSEAAEEKQDKPQDDKQAGDADEQEGREVTKEWTWNWKYKGTWVQNKRRDDDEFIKN